MGCSTGSACRMSSWASMSPRCPPGFSALRPGTAFAAADSLRITLFGRGGHGSRPEATIDPVVMAAATVMRLQTVVSREIAGNESAVVTIGALRAGTKENIIPDTAELLLSVRTYDAGVRDRVLDAISRIVRAEAAASGAPRDPQIELTYSFPAVVNDPAAAARTRPASRRWSARTGSSTRDRSPAARTSACSPRPPAHPACSGCSAAATRHRSRAPRPPRRSWTCFATCRPTTHRITRR